MPSRTALLLLVFVALLAFVSGHPRPEPGPTRSTRVRPVARRSPGVGAEGRPDRNAIRHARAVPADRDDERRESGSFVYETVAVGYASWFEAKSRTRATSATPIAISAQPVRAARPVDRQPGVRTSVRLLDRRLRTRALGGATRAHTPLRRDLPRRRSCARDGRRSGTRRAQRDRDGRCDGRGLRVVGDATARRRQRRGERATCSTGRMT